MKHTTVWLACLLALPIWSQAVSLSEPVVRSGLGQRFIAEIEIKELERSAWPTLTAVIASPELYEEQGIQYPGSVADMSIFVLRHGDGRPYFRLVGHHPLNEAFVDLILDVGWSQGHLVRKFTILPEPPADDPRQQEGADGLTLIEREAKKEQRFQQRKIDPADQMIGLAQDIRRTEPVEPDPYLNHDSRFRTRRYYIHRNENLFRVALRWKESRLGIHQRMIALYQTNPDLFIGGNPNRLIRGRWMATPKVPENIPDTEADAYAQWQQLINSPEQWLAGKHLPEADESSSQPETEEHSEMAAPVMPSESVVVKKTAARKSGQRERLVVSHGLSKKDIRKYQRLIKMENEIRKLIEESEKRAPVLSKSSEMAQVPAIKVSAERFPTPVQLNNNAAAPAVPSAEPVQESAPAAETPIIVTPATVPQQESSAAALGSVAVIPKRNDTAASKDGNSPAATSAPVQSKAVKRNRRFQHTQTPPFVMEESVLAAIPLWVGLMASVAAIVAIAAGVYSFRHRRRRNAAVEALLKESAELADASSIFTDTGQSLSEVKASAADLAGAGSLNRESLLNVDTDSHIDPITEADVYISYERCDAAEALLKTALEQNPDSREILWRLFDVYHKSGHAIHARNLAKQLHSMYELRDPKQRLICEVLEIEFGTAIISKTEMQKKAETAAEEEQTQQAEHQDIQRMVIEEVESEEKMHTLIASQLFADTQNNEECHLPSHSAPNEEKTEKGSHSLMSMINIEIPPLNFDLLDTFIENSSESPVKAENSEDGTIHSQLELAKLWVAQGKVASARILLEAIVETGTSSQKDLALALLNTLSGSDEVP